MTEALVTSPDDGFKPFAGETTAGPAAPDLVNRLNDAARVVGRVAHDFANVLMGVMGFAELAKAAVEPNSPAAEYLSELQRSAQRGLDATQQMRCFTRCGRRSSQPTRLNEFWKTSGLSDVAKGIRLQAHLSPRLPPVAMAPDHVLLVLTSLLRNAAESMPDGGAVAVSARLVDNAELSQAVLPADLQPGPYVEVAVTDHGTGFAPDVLRQLSDEPFVTNKARHRGLGLATVLRCLQAHGGGLTIASTPTGSTVRVFLPPALTPESTPNDSPA